MNILYKASSKTFIDITLTLYGLIVKLGNISLLLRYYFMPHGYLVVILGDLMWVWATIKQIKIKIIVWSIGS